MSDFNFKAYNELMKNANAGLKLALVENMLRDVVFNVHMYKNPLEPKIVELYDKVSDVRTLWKVRTKRMEQNDSSERTASVDNAEQQMADRVDDDPKVNASDLVVNADKVARIIAKQQSGATLSKWEENVLNQRNG